MVAEVFVEAALAAPVVDDALCASLDELVSVEKPESWMTLPLPSPLLLPPPPPPLLLLPPPPLTPPPLLPLFGCWSFLPLLCELLRLRISDDDDVWMRSAACSFCVSLRRTRMPGSQSRLQHNNKQTD